MFAVFLNNKLISCDSVLPLMMEAHVRTGRPVRFYTTDAETFDTIKQNRVLIDAIGSVGKLVLLGRRRKSLASWLTNRIRTTAILAHLSVKYILGRADFIHFRALNERPLSILGQLGHKRIFFAESDSYGETKLMLQVSEAVTPRKRNATVPAAGALIAFQPSWQWLDNPATGNLPRYLFGSTRTRKIWIDFVRTRADAYFDAAFSRAGIPPRNDVIVFMLGYLGKLDYLRTPDTTKRLFDETIDILVEEAAGTPIFLKPHVFTDMAYVERARTRHPDANIVIDYLHPSVLAVRAKFFIANYYSTTLGDAFHMNVPTIEYTDYSAEALRITAGGSMRPEFVSHFINNDSDALRIKVRQLLDQPRVLPPIGQEGDTSGLLNCFADRDRPVSQPVRQAAPQSSD